MVGCPCDNRILDINLKYGMMILENRLAVEKRSYRRTHFLHGHLWHAALLAAWLSFTFFSL